MLTGLLLVDKPSGITSHDVVDRIRRAADMRRIGHTGTLDPAATGLLILCLGKATRLSEHLTGLDKTYEGIMRLGIVTDSHDLDCSVQQENPVPGLSLEAIQAAAAPFTGEIDQIPPMVSAVKIGGERLYRKARKGEVVERPPRRVMVHEFTMLSCNLPDIALRVRCSSGTYVRTLCHDVGAALGCGAALAALRRTAVGRFDVSQALPVDAFTTPETVTERLIPIDEALDLPAVFVRNSSQSLIAEGSSLGISDLREPCAVQSGWVQIKSAKGKLLALGMAEATLVGARIHPKRVFI